MCSIVTKKFLSENVGLIAPLQPNFSQVIAMYSAYIFLMVKAVGA